MDFLSDIYGLSEIEVAGDNPALRSEDNVLFTKEGTLVFYPRDKKEKEYAVNLISRRWNSVKDAWKREGIRGVYDLVNCRLHYRKDIREMAARRAAADLQYDTWFREQLPGSDEQHLQHERKFSHTLSFLIPTYNTRPDLLRALADSLLSQTCDAWEACMYDGASSNQETISMLKQIADEDERFHVVFGRENLGISENTNKALFLASIFFPLTVCTGFWMQQKREPTLFILMKIKPMRTVPGSLMPI